jgi:chromosome partitioning protein
MHNLLYVQKLKNGSGDIITTIAFCHHKGGTGKTTSCLNIAGFCVQSGKKVLVVDCDPQANATAGLGVSPDASGKNMYDVFMSRIEGFPETRIQDVIRKTASGIDLAPSHLDLVGAEPYLYQTKARQSILADALRGIKDMYDIILIDTPPSMGQFVINGLFAADHTIVTLDSGSFALSGISNLQTIFSDIKVNFGKEIRVGMAIVSRWGEGKTGECLQPEQEEKKDLLSLIRSILFKAPKKTPQEEKAAEEQKGEQERLQVMLDDIKRRFSVVYIVPYSPDVYEAQIRGMPISHYAPESGAGLAYRTIADEVMRWS